MVKAKKLARGRIKNRMKVLLAEKGMTVKDFAKAANLHYTTARRFCSGEQENVNLPVLAIACETLNVEPGDILVHITSDESNSQEQPRQIKKEIPS